MYMELKCSLIWYVRYGTMLKYRPEALMQVFIFIKTFSNQLYPSRLMIDKIWNMK